MKSYVIEILVPYFNEQKKHFSDRAEQKCIWQIDVWSVHRSDKFRTWMKTTYTWIIVIYVPGGCTPLLQACDVGIQKVLKLAIKKAAHRDVVTELLDKMDGGISPEAVMIDKRVGGVRDRSVGWLLEGYKAINNAEFVKQVCAYAPMPAHIHAE